ncbi:hypothetical protein Nmel_005419 [Mimus melanotis]
MCLVTSGTQSFSQLDLTPFTGLIFEVCCKLVLKYYSVTVAKNTQVHS